MKKYIVYLALFLLPFLSYSQSTNITTAFLGTIKKADYFFNHYAYRNALNLYLHAYDREPRNVYVQDQIADCYFKLHKPDSAAYWFSKIINEPNLHTESKFEYAEALSMIGKYTESRHWFEQYLKEHPDSKMAREKINFIDHLDNYKLDSARYIVTGVAFNSDHSDYGAHYFHGGIVFASSRDLDWYLKHSPFDAVDLDESLLNMYYVPGKVHGEHGEVEPLHKEHIKSVLHEGPMAFFNNDTRAAYTRTNIKNGKPVYDKTNKAHLQILFADVKTLASMTNITPFEHNGLDYSVAHPSLSPDGSLMYYSSTAPGGFGGSDIYVTHQVNGKWSDPVNLGPNINTAGEESFPFYANDSTLYFSSNGHGSLGGLDVLVSRKRNNVFTKAINFGGPLNSRFDDFSLVTDSTGRVGYIASNRAGGKGLDDIYYYIATWFGLVGKVVDQDSTHMTLQGTAVYAVDPDTGKVYDADVTDSLGFYELNVPFDKSMKIVAYKDGYELLKDQPYSTIGKPMGVDTLNMGLWRKELFAEGKIYSNETQQPLTGVTMHVFDLTANKLDSVILVDQSAYHTLLKPDRNYRLEFTKPGFNKSEVTLDTKGLRKGVITNDVVMHEKYIDHAIVYFEYDKSDLKQEELVLLDPLVKTLKGNPKATLNIGAHADSRGGHDYNQRLSDNRSLSVVQYFVSKGISRKRITARGFGERLLLNRCSDTVTCEEVDHSLNRRAEVKVQMKTEEQPMKIDIRQNQE